MKTFTALMLMCFVTLVKVETAAALSTTFFFADTDASRKHLHKELANRSTITCLAVPEYGELCFMNNLDKEDSGVHLCHNGIFLGNGFGDLDAKIIKTPKKGVYLLYCHSSGLWGGGNYSLLYITDDRKVACVELSDFFHYVIADDDIKFSMNGKTLAMTIMMGDNKRRVVSFDGSTIKSPYVTKMLSQSDFNNLQDANPKDNMTLNLLHTLSTAKGIHRPDISQTQLWNDKINLDLSPDEAKSVLAIVTRTPFSSIQEIGNYYVLQSPETPSEKLTVDNIEKHAIIAIHKLSGAIEVAWICGQYDEFFKRKILLVHHITSSKRFCMSIIVDDWVRNLQKKFL